MGPSLHENFAQAAAHMATGGGMRLPSSLGGLGHEQEGQKEQGWQGQTMRAVRLSWWLQAPLFPEMTL